MANLCNIWTILTKYGVQKIVYLWKRGILNSGYFPILGKQNIWGKLKKIEILILSSIILNILADVLVLWYDVESFI